MPPLRRQTTTSEPVAAVAFNLVPAAVDATLRGLLVLADSGKRVMLLADSYEPDTAHATWEDVAAHEIVGPGYTPGGVAASVSAATLDGSTAALAIDGALTWPGSSFTAKYAVMVHAAGASVASSDSLVGWSDLNPDGDALTLATGTLELTFEDNEILALEGDAW